MSLLFYKIYSSEKVISHQKPVLVFLHGMGASSALWIPQIKKLKKDYDLVLIDLPSHGKSEVMLSSVNPTFEVVNQMILDVLDHLEIKKATFIGCSLGTLFIKHLMVTHPERVEKYILIGAIGEYRSWHLATIRIISLLLPVLPLRVVCTIAVLLFIPQKQHATSRNLFLASSKNLAKKELASWLILLQKFPATSKEYLTKLETFKNGLYISGEDDSIFLDPVTPEFAKAAKAVVLKDCGHVCNIDKAQEVTDLIYNFAKDDSIKFQTNN